jgi:hypothetical protein
MVEEDLNFFCTMGLKQSIPMSQVTLAGEAVKLGHNLVAPNWCEAKVKLVQYKLYASKKGVYVSFE